MKMMLWYSRFWVCWFKWLLKGWLNWFWWECDWEFPVVCYSVVRDGAVWLWWKLFQLFACAVLVVGFGIVLFGSVWLVRWLFGLFPL
jgi:hypothetical protein